MGQEKKSEKDTVTIKNETLRKYFPRSYTPKQMEEKIIHAFGCSGRKNSSAATNADPLTKDPMGSFLFAKIWR